MSDLPDASEPLLAGKLAVALSVLSMEESQTLSEQERIILSGERSHVETGRALAKIRDERLYRDHHKTFEAYCRGRWGFSRKRAYQLMGAAERATLLSTIVDTVAPSNESQVRPLVGRPDDEAIEIWKLANSMAAGAPVTGRLVKQAIKSLLGEVPKPAKPLADLLESVLRSCQNLASHVGDTDLSRLDPKDKARIAEVIEAVLELAKKAGCRNHRAGSDPRSREQLLAEAREYQDSIKLSTRHHQLTPNP
jgi:hypothetical protein